MESVIYMGLYVKGWWLQLIVVVPVKLSINVEKLRVAESGELLIGDVELKISDADLNAIEEAVKLKEQRGGKVILISVLTWGPVERRRKEALEAIRRGLAMGADEAIMVIDEQLVEADTRMVSKILATVIRREVGDYDLVMLGEGSVDSFTMQIPGRLAGELGVDIVPFASKVDFDGKVFRVESSLEDRVVVFEGTPPLVVSVTREINIPRLPKLRDILRAKRKPVREIGLEALGLGMESKVRFLGIEAPKAKRKGVLIEGETPEEKVGKLIAMLRKEGVLK